MLVEIKRKDGTLQYGTYEDGRGYLLYGSGFYIGQLDCESVREINEVPPKMVIGKAYFDDGPKYSSITDTNDRWNGWHKPFIHEKSIKKFCKEVTWDEFVCKVVKGVLYIKHDDEESVIQPTEFFGEKYYYLGNEGLTFNFKRNEIKN